MKFLEGFVAAFVVSALAAFLVIISGAYNVAATAPHSELERVIFNSTMRHSVRARAGKESREVWSEDQVRSGFEEYDNMCIICHAAPGKEPGDIRKGLQPEPPNLAEAAKQWSSAGTVLDHQEWRQNDGNASIWTDALRREDLEHRGFRSALAPNLGRGIQGDGGAFRKILRARTRPSISAREPRSGRKSTFPRRAAASLARGGLRAASRK